MNTYVVCCYHRFDWDSVVRQLEDKGGKVFGIVTIPFWDFKGLPDDHNYAILYQSKEEIAVEVKN